MAVGHEKTIGSKGKGLFGIPHAQLPAKIQHVYNDLVESGKPIGGHTYRLAVGIVQNWAAGHDGKGNKVSTKVQAEAAAAITEWEKLKAKAHSRSARKGAKNVSESKLGPEAAGAARKLLEALGGPSLRGRDRAATLTGRLLGEAPRDHAHARELLEAALDDCGCGGAPALVEAKPKPKDDGDAEDKSDKGADDELENEVARLKKKGMPEKMARKVAEKKLKEGEEQEPHGGHSRLATRLTESPGAMLGLLLFDPLKHPRARGGKFAKTTAVLKDSHPGIAGRLAAGDPSDSDIQAARAAIDGKMDRAGQPGEHRMATLATAEAELDQHRPGKGHSRLAGKKPKKG